jgi:hypothetical protein
MQPIMKLIPMGVLVSLMILTASCTNEPEIIEESIENTVEVKELGFNNCGVGEPLTGKEQTTYKRSHRAYWEVGGTTGVGGEIPVSFLTKFNIDLSLSAKYGQANEEEMIQTREFDLDVPADMQKQYAFFWNITHRIGYVLIEGKKVNFDYPEKMEFIGPVMSEMPCNVFIASDILLAEIPGFPTPTPNPDILSYGNSWINANPQEGDITNIEIVQDGNYLLIDVALYCSMGSQCHLPRRQIFFSGSPIQVTYTSSYKDTDLEISVVNNDRLYVQTVERFTKTPYGVYVPDQFREYYLQPR